MFVAIDIREKEKICCDKDAQIRNDVDPVANARDMRVRRQDSDRC